MFLPQRSACGAGPDDAEEKTRILKMYDVLLSEEIDNPKKNCYRAQVLLYAIVMSLG